jgi:type I restriction enzyme S subunit
LPYEKIGKNDPVCIADEVPFEIPESWEWVRLGSVCQLNDGKKLQSKTYNNLDARYMRGKAEAKVLEAGKFVTKGTYLILVDGENSGEVFIAPEDGYMGSTFKILWISAQLYARYILKFIELYKEPLRNSKKGAAIPHLNKEIFFNLLLPVPSLQEQTRIVDKIVELTPSVERYDLLSRRSDELNRNFPNFLKKSILQYAVQGKLVSQDPTDEPASVLLEHIRAEKEKLIKSGKIKRDKHESVIFRRDNSYYERVDGIERCIDDEIPFEIPENWEVVRLQNIGEYRKGPFGSSLTKSMFVPKSKSSIKVYEQKNAIQKDCTLGTYYIPMEYYNEKMKGFTVLPNDIIVSCAGTIGETYILPSSAEIGIINQALMRMRITSQINVDYFLIYFDYMVKETARESSKGSAIKNIPPFDIFKKIILPLPPLKEQKRIVQEVQTIQSLISSL